jgi:hypothetical protein
MRDRKKKYEKDRERKFLESWKQDRPWLHHNGENNVMICNWCIEASGPKDLSFVSGEARVGPASKILKICVLDPFHTFFSGLACPLWLPFSSMAFLVWLLGPTLASPQRGKQCYDLQLVH